MKINAISSINFQRKFRVSKDEKNIDKTLQASALVGSYATVGTVGLAMMGTDVTSTAFSSESMGSHSLNFVPYTINAVADSAPGVASSSAEHPSSVSTGLYSTRQVAHNLNERVSKKVIPSLEKQIKGENESEFAPFEYVEIGDKDDFVASEKSYVQKEFVDEEVPYRALRGYDSEEENKYAIVDNEMNDLLFSEEEMNTKFKNI